MPVTSQAPPGGKFRNGAEGPIKHPRIGLVGAVQFWAKGSRENVVVLLRKLIRHFGVEASVRAQLERREARDAETCAWMVSRAREIVEASKPCTTAEQQRLYLTTLAIFAPPHGSKSDSASMANRVAAHLGVTRGQRAKRPGEEQGRPRAFHRAQDLRAAFDARLADLYTPMGLMGDEVLCRGQLAKLTAYQRCSHGSLRGHLLLRGRRGDGSLRLALRPRPGQRPAAAAACTAATAAAPACQGHHHRRDALPRPGDLRAHLPDEPAPEGPAQAPPWPPCLPGTADGVDPAPSGVYLVTAHEQGRVASNDVQ